MTWRYCEPIILPDCPLDSLTIGELEPEPSDVKAYEVAVAIARAATAVIRAHGLMEVADTFVTIGSPGAWPDCCNVVGVGIIEFETQTDGACWTRSDPVFELLISSCKPQYDDRTGQMPKGGPLDGCDVDTLNGHALAFLRLIGAINRDLRAAVCCFLPEMDCPCCGSWTVEAMTVENSEACSEVRLRIVRG